MRRALLATLLFAVSILFLSSLSIDESVKKGLILLSFGAIFWITEALPLPITSLLIPVMAVFMGVASVKEALSSFAHPIIFLFFGGFVLAAALSRYNLDRLIAQKIVALSRGSFLTSAFLLFVATAFLSMWISNTSTTAIMLPLALGLVGGVLNDRAKEFLLLGVAYSASVGGIGTLVGSPPNAITAAELGMGFAQWFSMGIKLVAILLPTLFFTLYLIFRPKGEQGRAEELKRVEFNLGRSEVLTLAVFLLTVCGWLFSKPLSSLFGIGKYFDSVVALVGVSLLFLLKLVDWKEVEKKTDWGTLYLFGGGIALSSFMKSTGASKFIASLFIELVSPLPLLALIFCVSLFMIFLTELMSNTATAAIFIPILTSAAVNLGLPPHLLALPAGVAASCAFMLPVATPPNAIVYGTGLVKQRSMLKAGFVLNLTFALVISLYFYLVR